MSYKGVPARKMVNYEYVHEDETYRVVEVYPPSKKPNFRADKLINWEFLGTYEGASQVATLFPRKHVYILAKEGMPLVTVGFNPPLTQNQKIRVKKVMSKYMPQFEVEGMDEEPSEETE